jgi:hypothetical protein
MSPGSMERTLGQIPGATTTQFGSLCPGILLCGSEGFAWR